MREKYKKLMEAKERHEQAQPATIQFLRVVREQEEKQQQTETQLEVAPIVLFSYR
jgi:hypothetical protein